jgi:GDPmannose 4,6-dehydratase
VPGRSGACVTRVVLVTGVAGQDGTLLAQRLVDDGCEVHGIVRSEGSVGRRGSRTPPGVTIHVADVADPDQVYSVVAAVEPDEIYHLAGVSSVAQSWAEPVLTGQVTGVGAVCVFEAAHRVRETTGRSITVLLASSAEIFGAPDHAPQDETTPIRPVSPYGAAKAYAHLMAQTYRERGLRVATVILYNHESSLREETFVTRKITTAVARVAVDRREKLVLGALDVRRDWGWAEDYVDAMVRAARHVEADDFVIATGVSHSVADFVSAAFRRIGVASWRDHVVIDPLLARPVDQSEIVGDAAKARRVLGWGPTVEFDEMVARMVDHDVRLLTGSG